MRVIVTDMQSKHKYDIHASGIVEIARFLMNTSKLLIETYNKREFIKFHVCFQRFPENGRIDFDFVPDDI